MDAVTRVEGRRGVGMSHCSLCGGDASGGHELEIKTQFSRDAGVGKPRVGTPAEVHAYTICTACMKAGLEQRTKQRGRWCLYILGGTALAFVFGMLADPGGFAPVALFGGLFIEVLFFVNYLVMVSKDPRTMGPRAAMDAVIVQLLARLEPPAGNGWRSSYWFVSGSRLADEVTDTAS